MRSIDLISFWTRTLYSTWFKRLLCHSTTIMIDTLYLNSTLNQTLTKLEQTHIRCFLLCEQWTVKLRDLHSFKGITYRTDERTKQFPRLKSWVISGNPQQWMEFRRLWWTVIFFKCSYLLQLFDFYCLLVQYLLFYWKVTFCSLFPIALSQKYKFIDKF